MSLKSVVVDLYVWDGTISDQPVSPAYTINKSVITTIKENNNYVSGIKFFRIRNEFPTIIMIIIIITVVFKPFS